MSIRPKLGQANPVFPETWSWEDSGSESHMASFICRAQGAILGRLPRPRVQGHDCAKEGSRCTVLGGGRGEGQPGDRASHRLTGPALPLPPEVMQEPPSLGVLSLTETGAIRLCSSQAVMRTRAPSSCSGEGRCGLTQPAEPTAGERHSGGARHRGPASLGRGQGRVEEGTGQHKEHLGFLEGQC